VVWLTTSSQKMAIHLNDADQTALNVAIHDRMTESVVLDMAHAEKLYHHAEPAPLSTVDILQGGQAALEAANH